MNIRIVRSAMAILVMTAAVLALPAAASAQSVTTSTSFSTSVYNSCTGENVTISGVQTNTMITNVDNAGGTHLSFAMVTKGTGVGAATGINYPYQENDLFKLDAGPGATSTVKVKNRLKGPGSIDNWDMTFHVHITINANGVPTSVIDTFETTCKG